MFPLFRVLLRLNETHSTGIPLVHDADLVGFVVAEDVEIVINVVQRKDGLLDGDGFAQVEATAIEKSV